MRFDSVEPTLILGGYFGGTSSYDEEEEKGIFSKIFKKPQSTLTVYEEQINKIGRDVLVDELLDEDYVLAYSIDSNQTKLYVVLTENYLILPGLDIITLENVRTYGLFNVLFPEFVQYAEDRKGIPYDPNYVSEFEGEETFELDRFSIMFGYVDNYGIRYKYTIYMDIDDRKDFYEYLFARLEGKVDFTRQLVLDGEFEKDTYENWFYKLIN